MKLTDLEPEFLKWTDDQHFSYVENIAEADGLLFLCPTCFQKNNGPIGTHAVICWKPNVPQSTQPTPGRWSMQGTGLHDLTLVAGSSSVLLQGGCNAHFYIRNGNIEML